MGDCPECGASFFVPLSHVERSEESCATQAGMQQEEPKKVVLPTEHTGNLRADRAKKAPEKEGDADDSESRNPNAHRLNPEKRTKLVPLSELASESAEVEEWRVEGLERPGDDGEVAKEWSGKQFVILGIGLILAVSVGILAFALQMDVVPADEATNEPSQLEKMSELTEQLVFITEQFLAGSSIDERLRFVRNPSEVRGRMEDYYSREGSEVGLKIDGLPLATDLFTREGVEFAGVVMDFSDLTRRGTVFQRDGDRWLLDWESFVGYTERDWAAFLEEDTGEVVEFRLLASADDYYNFDYDDEKRFASYKLTDIESRSTCWGYCERESDTGKLMARAVNKAYRRSLRAAEVVIKVTFDGLPVERKQLRIEEFVQDSHLSP